MANLKEIQRKIKSVSNTKKTTRAMKLVSTAKLRKAEELAKRSRIYANKLNEVLSEITADIQRFKIGGIESRYFHPTAEPKIIDIVFVTADKGLCAGFNISTIKVVSKLLREYKDKKVKVRLRGVGKKGVEYFKFNGVELVDSVIDLSHKPDYERSTDFINVSINEYMIGNTDQVILIHNGYKNMITQEMHVDTILPIVVETTAVENSGSLLEFEAYDEEKMLEALVAKYAEYNMYYALIDSLAAEHSARMQAMDSATKNATEMVDALNIQFNKARQEAITTELIEIISGVESLK